MRRFAAPYDGVVAGITITMTVVLVALAAIFVGSGELILLVLGMLFGALLVACWGWAPKGYSVGPGALVVHRPFGDRHVLLLDSTTVGPFDKPRGMELHGWRVGGLFGAYGEFRVNGQRIYVAGRRASQAWAVTTGDDVTVVMPDRPEEFVAAIAQAALPQR